MKSKRKFETIDRFLFLLVKPIEYNQEEFHVRLDLKHNRKELIDEEHFLLDVFVLMQELLKHEELIVILCYSPLFQSFEFVLWYLWKVEVKKEDENHQDKCKRDHQWLMFPYLSLLLLLLVQLLSFQCHWHPPWSIESTRNLLRIFEMIFKNREKEKVRTSAKNALVIRQNK